MRQTFDAFRKILLIAAAASPLALSGCAWLGYTDTGYDEEESEAAAKTPGNGAATDAAATSATGTTGTAIAPAAAAERGADGNAVAPTAPPAPMAEQRPYNERPDAVVWRSGYWRWTGQAFVWEPGYYMARPAPTAVWQPDQWIQRSYGWTFMPGQWQ